MASYPIPPWLHGNNPTELAALAQAGMRSRQQFDIERQRMQQQSQMAEMELAAKQAAQEQAQMRQSQDLQVEKAYKDASLGLRERELNQQQQKVDFQIKSASQKAMAQAEASSRIAAGEDPTKVWMEMGPELGMTANAMASLTRKGPGEFPGAQAIEGLPENYLGVQTGPGTRQVVRLPEKFQGGSVQGIPVLDPVSGEPIEGAYAIPSPSGGVSVHNAPKMTGYEAAAKNLASKQAAGGTKAPAPMTKGSKKPTAEAIDYLRAHPDTALQFDKKYGAGSADKFLNPQQVQ